MRLRVLVAQIVLHRTVNTDGGDYAEGMIDKRTFQQYSIAVDKLIIATQADLGVAAARTQTEQLYLEEIRWRYAEWRTRYVPLAMEAQRRQPSMRSFRPMERQDLFFVGLQQAFA